MPVRSRERPPGLTRILFRFAFPEFKRRRGFRTAHEIRRRIRRMGGSCQRSGSPDPGFARSRDAARSGAGMRATPPLRAATFPHGASGVALIIYQFSGRQRYTAGSREFSLSGGQMLLVPPGCACSTGACPLEKGSSAWLLVGVNSLEAGPSVERQWGESMVMKHLLIPSGPGTFLMEAGSRELIGVVFDAWDRHSHMLVREMVRNCVATLMVGAAMRVTGAETGDARNENDFRIQRVLKWMDETQDFEVCRDKLTNISGLSASGFHYHFKRVTGSSPMDYWLRLRVERAAQRLREQPDLTITRVAHEFGFSSSQYFATVFRRYLGSSPQTHREAAPQGA